jgi:hypothetical protein
MIAVTAVIVMTGPARDARLWAALIGRETHVIVVIISSRSLISPQPEVAATCNQDV